VVSRLNWRLKFRSDVMLLKYLYALHSILPDVRNVLSISDDAVVEIIYLQNREIGPQWLMSKNRTIRLVRCFKHWSGRGSGQKSGEQVGKNGQEREQNTNRRCGAGMKQRIGVTEIGLSGEHKFCLCRSAHML